MSKEIPTSGEFDYDVKDGEELIFENDSVVNLNCCDCGLSHRMKMKIVKKKIHLRFWRNYEETIISRGGKTYPAKIL